ncbi:MULTISPECIES: tetratricopeptide repeat protein [unclassified Campylobacter]|uniref:tetratricopeptide repeat protein n=1 Tax=unclassified Campylobacter TaxID=2593542 RepID=UPI0022E9F977|nr:MULTISPECIES: tetratricopeptide repeat protein [unclassified Campylobacter]MDA3061655.1 sel1 repeat family protein [Campylobacter sp. JMF_14 EL1]MDA3073239.1 sel1 repeat family protein [Campylobacter sp. JMF_10 EL2]
MKKILLFLIICIIGIFIQISFDEKFFYPKVACRLGSENSCSKINTEGNKFLTNYRLDEAEILLRTACEAKFYKACSNLGALYNKKSLWYLQHSCANGFYGACDNLGKFYVGSFKYDMAIPLFTDACDHGIVSSCQILAFMYYIGKGVQQNPANAMKFYEKACKLGSKNDCETLKKFK